jgi:hypothetical protein
MDGNVIALFEREAIMDERVRPTINTNIMHNTTYISKWKKYVYLAMARTRVAIAFPLPLERSSHPNGLASPNA